ncbi:MAG: GNAT family N-acetyltransferase, partial [Ferrovibrionaceae bacterium]
PALHLPGLRVRPERQADLPFVRRLYRTTRAAELAATGWDEALCRQFCDQQFDARRQDWSHRYPDAVRLLLLRGTDPVGRLYLDMDGPDWRVVDIAFLPSACGRGSGSALLADLIRQAGAAGKGLALSVDLLNGRALALYRRLGFVETGRDAARLHLRHPGAPHEQPE